MRTSLLFVVGVALACSTFQQVAAQKYPERRVVRQGNRQYERANYVEAEVRYKRANDLNPTYEGHFNLGAAIYQQQRYEDALKNYNALIESMPEHPQNALTHYNIGNTYYKMNKLQEAAEAYKQSLRLNPNDREAKFNLAYVLKKLEDQQKNGGGNNQNQNDKNKDQQNKDQNNQDQNNQDKQNQDKNKQNQDKNDQNKKKPDQQNGKDKENPDQKQGQQPQQMSREEADQLLKAMEAGEQRAREKVDAEKKRGAVVRSRKNW